jgi:hypothetical protein
LWTPPGQGEIEVADNHQEPGPKPPPRARHLKQPNQSAISSDAMRVRNGKALR